MPVQTSTKSTTYGNSLKISSLLVMAKWILSILTIVVSEIVLLLISNVLIYKINMITLIILAIIALCGGVGMIVISLFEKFDGIIANRRERESQTALATNTEQSVQLEKPTSIETLDQTNDNSSSVQLSIIEEPLTARNLVTTISALIELHTKCWLIVQRRFDDFMKYADTKHPRFEEEANLLFTKLTYDSPLSINLDISLKSLAEALKTAIDAIPQTQPRIKAIKLEDQGKEADTKLKQLKNIDCADGIAAKLVDDLSPGLDAETKITLTKGLQPSILQVGDISGLELS
jgi:hypothetical protein